jgi:hypothetical protein
MILSENRHPLFRVMLWKNANLAQSFRNAANLHKAMALIPSFKRRTPDGTIVAECKTRAVI